MADNSTYIVTNKTYAEMAALIAAGTLELALSYKITDRGDNGLLFRAAAPNRLENNGLRYMLCPTTYVAETDGYGNTWIGVWNAVKQATVTVGQLTIWNGLVWVAGAVLNGLAPDTVDSGWIVIPKASFTNHEYTEKVFEITYEFENDWISKQGSQNDNIFGMSYLSYQDFMGESYNLIDYCDWNNPLIFSNKCFFIYNNSNTGNICYNNIIGMISGNSNIGSIARNTCTDISGNSNNGNLNDNICVGISGNSNDGQISGNIISGSISGNSNDGMITNNKNNGGILFNSNIGDILANYNNGNITENSNTGGTTCNIQGNNNNGSITGSWNADVTDLIVTKTGTAV